MNADQLLRGIRDADFHFGGIRCLRLFRLERGLARALLGDVDRLCATEQGSDVQAREHVTNWAGPVGLVKQFSLLNGTGNFADFSSDHDLSCLGKQFHHAGRYPHLADFIRLFDHAINFRLNVLGPGASLSPHEEHSLFLSRSGTVAVRVRFHLPLRTYQDASMMLEGDVCRFAVRTVYYFNQGCVHAAANAAHSPRLHLVWDMLLTQRTFELMFGETMAPQGLRRLARAEQAVRVLARTRVPAYARLAPVVTPGEAEQVRLSPVQ